ncbi:hypothetical protein FN846DRAFT_774106 [Sphaerosporella brunnea]|uniref:Peptidase S54 rhomboid domain-containing protein n=1 Tax=Sphaerosporella brunnea TaxID=1250544 RepID=A0A5J5F5M6_9PEZI|nr:hypothetical protein FN846DRAFT_774106 [Sphaerosporella brunnea]
MSFSAFDYLEVPLAGQQHSEKWRWWTWGTYMFLHGSPVHLLCCTVAMTSIFRLLVPAFGAARVVTAWALSGVGAAAITTHVEVYRHGDAVRRGEGTAIVLREVQLPTGEVAVRQVLTADPAYKAMFASNMGSSAGLMGLMSVVAIAMPQTTWGLLFLPMEVPSRTIFAGLLAFDAAGVAGVIPDLGIGHLGHLSGAAVGALLYALWLRRLPASRHLWRLRRSGGYW